ncbi:MAG: hypothetical protein JSR62_11460 [Nitrospira sp.]|nr:hypothetical protein [Nitrospira sp.]
MRRTNRAGLLSGIVAMMLWITGANAVAGTAVARVLPTGDGIELEFPADAGSQKEVIPLFQSGTIRYFSAGIGQVEREAAYPPFALKLVFTAGGKPFVTGVGVTVRNAKGAAVLTIPREQSTGPWLFIDLPEGAYEVVASLGGVTHTMKSVAIRRGHVTTQHIRWAEDRSPPLPAEAGPES